MAKDCSFDVVSEFDKQELVNAIDQTKRDIQSRFDLKDSNSTVELDADKTITITTNDNMKLKNIWPIPSPHQAGNRPNVERNKSFCPATVKRTIPYQLVEC